MQDTLTTLGMILLTLLAAAASVVALARLRSVRRVQAPLPPATQARGSAPQPMKLHHVLVWLVSIGAGALFLYREIVVHSAWQPLAMHVDGLLLITCLLGLAILYLGQPARTPGLSAFALPLLTLLLAWGICASVWTAYAFDIQTPWKTMHLASVYLGALFFAIAAGAGVMYLYAQSQLRHKRDPALTTPVASLEAIETLIVRTSALGFAVLSLGLIMGLVLMTHGDADRLPGWWYTPKMLLSAGVWLIYALVMNVRYTTNFRGARAAWLSIAGMVLLLATFGLATALPTVSDAGQPVPPTTPRDAGHGVVR